MTDARAGEGSQRIRVLRELGSPAGADVAFCAALDAGGGRPRLVVVERVLRSSSPGGVGVGAQDVNAWLEGARRLVPLEHPNVARVRDAIDGAAEAYVVSDFIDGTRWSDLVAGSGLPLDIAVRALLDALAGLGALHNMRDAARQPLGLVHCGVTSESVLVGLDGVTRILGTSRLRGVAPATGAHYLAPEVLLEDDAADARADVYSAGVLLWEALSGRPLFTETGASAIVTAVLSGRIPRAEAPVSAAWAGPLVDVAARALSPDPAKRHASAAAMAAELRRIGGTKIVPSIRVAALVRSSFGERIKSRREELERGDATPRVVSGTAAVMTRTRINEDAGRASDAPTPIPPAPTATPTATTRPPPPFESDAPRAALPVPAAAVSLPVTLSDPPITVEPTDLLSLDSIPAVPAKSGASPPDAGGSDVAPVDDRVTNPAPKHASAPESDEEEMTMLVAPLVPRELREPTAGTSPPAPTGAASRPGPPPAPAPADALAPLRKRRVVMIAAIAVSLVVVSAAAAMWIGGGDPKAKTESVPAAPAVPIPTSASTSTSTLAATPTAAPPPTPPAAVPPAASPSPAESTSSAPPPPAKPKPVMKYDPQGI